MTRSYASHGNSKVKTEMNRWRGGGNKNGRKQCSSTVPTISVANPSNKDQTFTMPGTDQNNQLYTKLNDILYNEQNKHKSKVYG